jgi:hypothetical protein
MSVDPNERVIVIGLMTHALITSCDSRNNPFRLSSNHNLVWRNEQLSCPYGRCYSARTPLKSAAFKKPGGVRSMVAESLLLKHQLPDRESLPATIAESIRVGPHPCWLDGSIGASNSSVPFHNCTEALATARPSESHPKSREMRGINSLRPRALPKERSDCRPPFVSDFRPPAPPAAHREDSCGRLARSMMAGCALVPGNAVRTSASEYLRPPKRFFLTFSLLDVP